MPKVILNEKERQKRRIYGCIAGKMKERGVTLEDIGKRWGITAQGAAYRIHNGKVTLMDFYSLQKLLCFSSSEINLIIGGEK